MSVDRVPETSSRIEKHDDWVRRKRGTSNPRAVYKYVMTAAVV